LYSDNDERAIFFAKGVVETVKKLNWVPDIIHVHGWMASLLPVYLKHYYKDEGIFGDTKIITSVYASDFEGTLDAELITKLAYDNLPEEAISKYKEPVFTNLMKATIDHSDAIIMASENLPADLTKYIETSKKPFLPFTPKETFKETYLDFLKNKVQ
jgi:starch synthase